MSKDDVKQNPKIALVNGFDAQKFQVTQSVMQIWRTRLCAFLLNLFSINFVSFLKKKFFFSSYMQLSPSGFEAKTVHTCRVALFFAENSF